MYPLLLEPVYKEMVWGGNKLKDDYSRNTPFERTGESWDISCRENEMCIVKNGIYKGEPFISVIMKSPVDYMGKKHSVFKDFPLLVKLIDANDFLSVQVHPDDTYAQKNDNYPSGKNEMWYILSAEQGSYLVVGLKDGVTKEILKKAISGGTVENCLHKLYVSKGDVINIPAGLVHSIGKGIVLAEIQQNSDITYRLYDYNRLGLDGKKRELHIEKSLDVIDFSGKHKKTQLELITVYSDFCVEIKECVKNECFSTYIYDVKKEYKKQSDINCFNILTCVEGCAKIKHGADNVLINKGDSVFIPAALGEYVISGSCWLIESYA